MATSVIDGVIHTVLIEFWSLSCVIFCCLLAATVVFGLNFYKHTLSTLDSDKKKSNKEERTIFNDVITDETIHHMTTATKKKKTYADFLIDRPFDVNQSKKKSETTFNLMNCLRHRLQITVNIKTSNLEADFLTLSDSPLSHHSPLLSSTAGDYKSNNYSLYDTLLELVDEFDANGIAEMFSLLLERRTAIPLFVPKSKKHYFSLLRHITFPGMINTRLGEDKSLMRVAVISCRQRNQSQTCEILKKVFNIDSIHSHDLTTSNISSEIMLAEIGCGYMLTEGSGSQKIENVLVVHVLGDFRPLWSFLRRFADCFLIEDSTVESESFFSSFMTEEKKREIDLEDTVILRVNQTNKSLGFLIWKPSYGESIIEEKETNGWHYWHIEDQLSDKTLVTLKRKVVLASNHTTHNRMMLYNITILETEGYSSLECVSPAEHELLIAQSVKKLENVKKNEFLLQKTFLQESKHEEAKMENRLNEDKVREEDAKIQVLRATRRIDTHQVETHSLLKLFLGFLEKDDPCSRVFSIRVLEKELTKRGELELGPQLENVKILSASYYDKLNRPDQHEKDLAKENLHKAKANLIESVLNMEHLWRELSHLYVDTEPGKCSSIIKKIPRLAAQHLMDGFCLELLDGDSIMIHTEWVTKVLFELSTMLKRKRIFVLSVLGIQSSGKSTLLNTMFGIRMRTSVGQCTRGVNMQLVPVEGRPEYDYILLLDTEGTRSSEYHGLSGSEKRDNQMATLSILLSDATIVVIPGENDAAVKEILPIVLMAYQGSKLAEDNGGRLSSRMFFVYNRIDTKQKNKLDSIIQALATSLHEAFSHVQRLTGNLKNFNIESPFANFKLVTSDSSGSDVCILGNVKKQSEPPGDVPDEAYGKGLIQFREHIHRRVTNVEGDIPWKGRSIKEFSSYIKNVWTCICSANFIFSFSTIMEQIAFNKLDLEYKKIERKLAEAYEKSFTNVKIEMMKLIEEHDQSLNSTSMRGPDGQIRNRNKNSSVSFESFEDILYDELFLIEQELNKEVDDIVNKRGRENWKRQFQEMWENNKKNQAFNWKCNLMNAYNRLFNYEYHVEKYKKKMRKEINELFKSSTNSWTEEQKSKKFEEMFDAILDNAKTAFPPKDVLGEIKKVYINSIAIKTRQIEIKWPDIENCLSAMKNNQKSYSDSHQNDMTINFMMVKEREKNHQNSIALCFESICGTLKGIAAGKLCYDDSIISNAIREVDATITTYHLADNSVVQQIHEYGIVILVDLMRNIEYEWETENSVPAKLESNKDIMRQYFMMVSQGVAKTKLFAAIMAATLEKSILPAFEKEMMQKTFQRIRKEQWLYNSRYMQKHMDLYLIKLLEEEKLNEVLDNIADPKRFYNDVLHQLIAKKVPDVNLEWKSFKKHLKEAIKKAAAVEVGDRGRAHKFVKQLRKEFLEGYLQSETLGTAFQIDCSGEYEDCDHEEKKEFQEECLKKLRKVLKNQVCVQTQENYAKELSPKVVRHMITLNDKAALPRCDACCRLCKGLCIEPVNHNTKFTLHDAIHQPGGVAGINNYRTIELDPKTCNQCYEQDHRFYFTGDYKTSHHYRDYANVFPEWKNPRINEELPLREYILATYNKQIAEKYRKKPSTNIPPSYFRKLPSIKENLQREIDGW